MSVGFIELITILLSLGGFGIEASPGAPSAAEIMKYAPDSADFMVHLDVHALVPGNYEAFTKLPASEALAATPDVREMVQEVTREVEALRGMLRGLSGVDPIEDIHSVSAWLELSAEGTPGLLVVVRGAIGDDLVGRIATMAGGVTVEVHDRKALVAPDGSAMLAVKDGSILAGTPAWVQARLASSWKAPRAAAGRRAAAARGRVAKLLEGKPFLALVSSPSPEAAAQMGSAVGAGGNVAADMASGHGFAAVALYHDGLAWEVTSRTRQGHERAVMASEGLIALLRAGHHASRGAARLALASLASYAGTDEAIDLILRRQKDLLALMDRMTGSGSFRVDMKARPGQRTIQVRARGNKLTDVVPIAGFAPLAGLAAYFTTMRREAGMSGMVSGDQDHVDVEPELDGDAVLGPEPAREAAPGHLHVGDVYRRVKRRRGME